MKKFLISSYLFSTPDTVNSLISGHPPELEKVSVSRAAYENYSHKWTPNTNMAISAYESVTLVGVNYKFYWVAKKAT